jgi:predicted ester cyclase
MTMIVIGRTTMTAYLDALIARADFAKYFATDVTLEMMGTDQRTQGRQAVEDMIRYLHEQAFDAHPELKSLVVEGERAALDAEFVGEHVADFAGTAATGKQVRVPYTVVYDLEGERITALRIYMPMDVLQRQLES